jgi:hypothetical protein
MIGFQSSFTLPSGQGTGLDSGNYNEYVDINPNEWQPRITPAPLSARDLAATAALPHTCHDGECLPSTEWERSSGQGKLLPECQQECESETDNTWIYIGIMVFSIILSLLACFFIIILLFFFYNSI